MTNLLEPDKVDSKIYLVETKPSCPVPSFEDESSGLLVQGVQCGNIVYNPGEFRPLWYNNRYLIGKDGTVIDLERKRIVKWTKNSFARKKVTTGEVKVYTNYRVCIVPSDITKDVRQYGHFQEQVAHLVVVAWQDKFNPSWSNLTWMQISGGLHRLKKGIPADSCGLGFRIVYKDGDTSNVNLSNLQLSRKNAVMCFSEKALNPPHKYILSSSVKRGTRYGSEQQMREVNFPEPFIQRILNDRKRSKKYMEAHKKPIADRKLVLTSDGSYTPTTVPAMLSYAEALREVVVVPELKIFFEPSTFRTLYTEGKYNFPADKFAVLTREDALAFGYILREV